MLQNIQSTKSELQEAHDKIKAYELSLSDSKDRVMELEKALDTLRTDFKKEVSVRKYHLFSFVFDQVSSLLLSILLNGKQP